jgi:hypothetical protein
VSLLLRGERIGQCAGSARALPPVVCHACFTATRGRRVLLLLNTNVAQINEQRVGWFVALMETQNRPTAQVSFCARLSVLLHGTVPGQMACLYYITWKLPPPPLSLYLIQLHNGLHKSSQNSNYNCKCYNLKTCLLSPSLSDLNKSCLSTAGAEMVSLSFFGRLAVNTAASICGL